MTARILAIFTMGVFAIGCSDAPLATVGAGPSPLPPSVLGTEAGGIAGASAVAFESAVRIVYAQGQDSQGSLHVQWVGGASTLTCAVEVWYSRYGEAIDYARIATFDTDRHEITFRVPGAFLGGRYRMSVCGVWSRWMYLDGTDGDSATSPVPPIVTPPSDPPVDPPGDEDDPEEPPYEPPVDDDGEDECPVSTPSAHNPNHNPGENGGNEDPQPCHGSDDEHGHS